MTNEQASAVILDKLNRKVTIDFIGRVQGAVTYYVCAGHNDNKKRNRCIFLVNIYDENNQVIDIFECKKQWQYN